MAGLITLEDILEEIVGEIHDEYDEHEEEAFTEISDREYVIDGAMSLDDVNDRLGTSFESEDYDSLGGLIIEHLDRLPELNDEVVTEDGVRLVVDKLDKNRVESVHVFLPEKRRRQTDLKARLPIRRTERHQKTIKRMIKFKVAAETAVTFYRPGIRYYRPIRQRNCNYAIFYHAGRRPRRTRPGRSV